MQGSLIIENGKQEKIGRIECDGVFLSSMGHFSHLFQQGPQLKLASLAHHLSLSTTRLLPRCERPHNPMLSDPQKVCRQIQARRHPVTLTISPGRSRERTVPDGFQDEQKLPGAMISVETELACGAWTMISST